MMTFGRSGRIAMLIVALALVASSGSAATERRPFLLGGIQLNEDDHERWAASLIQAGMNAVEVTVYAHQGAWHSPELWFADEEPSVLAEIRAARRNGLQVVLILRVALDHNDPANRFLWHGLIHPRTEAQLAEWFRRYTAFVVKWARIAEAESALVVGVASEMSSLEATLPVDEIPELAAWYLDDAKQLELRELVGEHLHLFGDADRIAMGAGDYASLDDFLIQRNQAEKSWARAATFEPEGEGVAGEEAVAERIERINRRRSLLEDHWRSLVSRVRQVFRGRLTLASNFDNYHRVAFWDALDLIGINAYFPLRKTLETPLSEADLAESWRGVFAEIGAFRATRELRQPVVFTELGYTRRQGVTVAPWSSAGFVPMWGEDRESIMLWSAQPIDPEERALAVSSLYEAWRRDDLPLAGILYWKLSSRRELGRYEPFMLYLGADSEDPLYEAFTRFADHVRPLDIAMDGRRPPLHEAVRSGDTVSVRRLARKRARRVARDDAGHLPLHWSCYQPDPSLVAPLLPPRAVSWRDELGETPLIKCARLDNVPVMRELLRHRSDPLAERNDATQAALHLAADLASAEMVELLLDHGAAAAEGDEDGVTPLHAAARRGDPRIVELMSREAGLDARDASGNRPVSYAAYYGGAEAFRLLLDAGTAKEMNAAGQSLLHLAAHGGDPEILRALLDHGLELDLADRDGRTPLHHAVMKTHRAAARLLLDHGAAIDRADRQGVTVVHLAAEKDDPHLLQLVLAREPVLDAGDLGGNTPLHYAADWGRVENVRLLLAAGSRPELRNDGEQTALELAEESGRKRVVELLRAAVTDPSLAADRRDPEGGRLQRPGQAQRSPG